MYTKQEASQLRQEFWTAFGMYMGPILSAEGEKINWVNYKTGEKNVYFRTQADGESASIAIEITHSDAEIQQIYYEHFKGLKKLLYSELGEEWTWKLHTTDENGKLISRIFAEIEHVSIFNKNTWPQLISFFKPRLIALDAFWSSAKYSFYSLH